MNARRAIARTLVTAALAGALASLAIGLWIPVKAELSQILLERAWQEVRAGNNGTRPWPWADTVPVARLGIPSLDVSWVVLSGASGRNLAFAPAQVDGSAAPGEPGATLIAGHRDTHFSVLEHIGPGTEIVIENAAGDTFRFAVTRTGIVDSRESRLRLDAAAPNLVLVTCYPFDAVRAGGPLRFVVQAEARLDERLTVS